MPSEMNRFHNDEYAMISGKEIAVSSTELSTSSTRSRIQDQETKPLLSRRDLVLLWCCMGVLSSLGCLGISPQIAHLWISWTTDPLRSIGILIPPLSIILTLRVWQCTGWELKGTWWGLLPIGVSYLLGFSYDKSLLMVMVGQQTFSVIPVSAALFTYASGIILLFAGPRVWRRAWFPLGMLLLCRVVPGNLETLVDIPLQHISAHVARSFATVIGFTPTTPQLTLMFSPDFGMFIAPGCDGVRGAITMAYVALVLGYLKRASIPRWVAYVAGGALLGYLFNFIRLCLLVVYYRIALGHPGLENVAKQADYVIGSCMFLVATLIFLRLARQKQPGTQPDKSHTQKDFSGIRIGDVVSKCAALTVLLLAVLFLPSSAAAVRRQAPVTPETLANHMPKQIGKYTLTRTWYEQTDGVIQEEDGAYSAPGSDEILLGVWVANFYHDPRLCWLTKGLNPDYEATSAYKTAEPDPIALGTAYYSDGVTESIVVSGACSPGSCKTEKSTTANRRFGFVFLKPTLTQLTVPARVIPFIVRIDRLHSDGPKGENYDQLSAEATQFLNHLNPITLSKDFQ